MKKIFFILGLAALAVAGYAMFKITNYDNGKENPQNDSPETGNQTEAQATEGSQTAGKGIDSEKD